MRLKLRDRDAKIHDRERWRRWFAWYPVRISSWEVVWLEVIETRDTYQWPVWVTEYREVTQ